MLCKSSIASSSDWVLTRLSASRVRKRQAGLAIEAGEELAPVVVEGAESLFTAGNILKVVSIGTTLTELLDEHIPESAKETIKNDLTKVKNKLKGIFRRQSLELVEELLEGTELAVKLGPKVYEEIKSEIEKHFGKGTTT